jgi:hypothetical protein
MKKQIIACVLGALLAACATTSSSSVGLPSRGYPPAGWSARIEAPAWTAAAHQALDAEAAGLLAATPGDIDAFCPGYRSADAAGRRAFYVLFLSEIARIESNFDPAARRLDPAAGSRRNNVNTGLLQISQERANANGCGIVDQRQLEDGATNVRCGVRILADLVGRDGVLTGYQRGWKGAARTWAPLRDTARIAQVQAATNAAPYCRRPR